MNDTSCKSKRRKMRVSGLGIATRNYVGHRKIDLAGVNLKRYAAHDVSNCQPAELIGFV
jgi:hypothetical protein